MLNEPTRTKTTHPISNGKAPQKLPARNAVVHEITPEMVIKVAAGTVGKGPSARALIADIDAHPYLALRVSAVAERFSVPDLTVMLERLNSTLDPRIFATCCAFLPITDSTGYASSASQREGLFAQHTKLKLSDVLSAKAASASELAIVAKAALQLRGVNSSYILGARAGASGSEHHAYIIIQDRGALYVWDAASPMQLGTNLLPRLFAMPDNFLRNIEHAKKAFLTIGQNIFKPAEQCGFGKI